MDETCADDAQSRRGGCAVWGGELDESSPRAEQPGRLVGVCLKAHQLALLRRCLDVEAGARVLPMNAPASCVSSKIGVMGDKVGAGKSFVILSLLLSDRPPAVKPSCVSVAFDMVQLTRRQEQCMSDVDICVLVISHSLCGQWSECLRRHVADGVRCIVVDRASRKKEVAALLRRNRENRADIILVTSTFYNDVAEMMIFRRLRVRRVIFDEADSIRIPKSQSLPTRFLWLVTASFHNLIAALPSLPSRAASSSDGGTLTSLTSAAAASASYFSASPANAPSVARRPAITMRCTGFLKEAIADINACMSPQERHSLVSKNKDAFVDACIQLPEIQTVVVRCRTTYAISVLSGNVDGALMERLNAGDVEGALQCVDPANVGAERDIVSAMVGAYIHKADRLREAVDRLTKRQNSSRAPSSTARLSPRSASPSSSPTSPSSSSSSVCLGTAEDAAGPFSSTSHAVLEHCIQGAATTPDRARLNSNDDGNSRDDVTVATSATPPPPPPDFCGVVQNGRQRRLQERIRALSDECAKADCRVVAIRDRIVGQDVLCSICYDDIRTKTITRCCSHPYCFACINRWTSVRKSCPMCKTRLELSDMFVVAASTSPTELADEVGCCSGEGGGGRHVREEASDGRRALTIRGDADDDASHAHVHAQNDKFENFVALVDELHAHAKKTLVFANYDTSLDKLRRLLTAHGVPHDFVKGTQAHVNRVIDAFKNSRRMNVLLMNATSYGSGLDLQNTTDIIMFHKFDDVLEHQVIGRAHRHGRTVPLRVWYLLHANEVSALSRGA